MKYQSLSSQDLCQNGYNHYYVTSLSTWWKLEGLSPKYKGFFYCDCTRNLSCHLVISVNEKLPEGHKYLNQVGFTALL